MVGDYSSSYFIQTNDIDLSGRYWIPLASFAGTYDGANYAIINLNIAACTTNNVGLFSSVSGTVKNLNITGGSLLGNSNVGSICGNLNGGTILNCNNWANVSGGYSNTGGIYGDGTRCTINACNNFGVVVGYTQVGGIGGYTSVSSTIKNCHNGGNISGSSRVGGIGGIGATTTVNCYNSGQINGGGSVGGISGYASNQTYTNCYNIGTIIGRAGVGGICGAGTTTSSYTTKLTKCYNAGNIFRSTSNATATGFGNICGEITSYTTITNCGRLSTVVIRELNDASVTITPSDNNNTTVINSVDDLLALLNNYVATNTSAGLSAWEIRNGENGNYPVFVID